VFKNHQHFHDCHPRFRQPFPKGLIFGNPDPSRFSLFRSFLYHNACHRTPQSGDSLGYHQHMTGHMECQWGSPTNSVYFLKTGLGTSLAIIDLERMWNMEVTHLSTKQRPFYFGLKQSGDVFDLLEPARSNIGLIQIEEHNIWTYLIFHHLFPILLPSLVLSYFLQCMQCMKSPISIIRIGL
jgi:hypothetical protein